MSVSIIMHPRYKRNSWKRKKNQTIDLNRLPESVSEGMTQKCVSGFIVLSENNREKCGSSFFTNITNKWSLLFNKTIHVTCS